MPLAVDPPSSEATRAQARRPQVGLTASLRALATPARLALAAILAGGLAVRVYGLNHGLPFAFHADESQHFTNVAVRMFDTGLDPHYFQNPSAFTYLVHFALRLQYGDEVVGLFRQDPTDIYLTARIVTVALAMAGVAAIYVVGRRLWGVMEGLVAAAVLAFAFLPVAYSRYAVTDVGVFLPIAAALYGMVKIHEDGARRYYVIAGLGFGFTIGFKYTAGLILLPVLAAVVLRARHARAPVREALVGVLVVLATGAAAFLVTTPYFLFDLGEALDELRAQRHAAGDTKVGQSSDNPLGFYLSTLTWGLGWAAAVAAAWGCVWQFRRDRARALLLATFPVILFLYLAADADRYFARWLMPAYPALALFAGVAAAGVARSISNRAGVRAAALGLLIALLVVQPLAAGVRTGTLLRKEDTREMARNFMLSQLPPGTGIVVDSAITPRYDLPNLGLDPAPGAPHLDPAFGAPPKTHEGYPPEPARPARFILDLEPGRIDRYRATAHCVVVSMSWTRDRAAIAGLKQAAAYYDRLERESKVIFHVDPYDEGADPPEFDFDQSMHLYYPTALERGGPEITIYRLDGCQAKSVRAGSRSPRRTARSTSTHANPRASARTRA